MRTPRHQHRAERLKPSLRCRAIRSKRALHRSHPLRLLRSLIIRYFPESGSSASWQIPTDLHPILLPQAPTLLRYQNIIALPRVNHHLLRIILFSFVRSANYSHARATCRVPLYSRACAIYRIFVLRSQQSGSFRNPVAPLPCRLRHPNTMRSCYNCYAPTSEGIILSPACRDVMSRHPRYAAMSRHAADTPRCHVTPPIHRDVASRHRDTASCRRYTAMLCRTFLLCLDVLGQSAVPDIPRYVTRPSAISSNSTPLMAGGRRHLSINSFPYREGTRSCRSFNLIHFHIIPAHISSCIVIFTT
jgi:hypothetical protein